MNGQINSLVIYGLILWSVKVVNVLIDKLNANLLDILTPPPPHQKLVLDWIIIDCSFQFIDPKPMNIIVRILGRITKNTIYAQFFDESRPSVNVLIALLHYRLIDHLDWSIDKSHDF